VVEVEVEVEVEGVEDEAEVFACEKLGRSGLVESNYPQL
jgi:hypothetical protein